MPSLAASLESSGLGRSTIESFVLLNQNILQWQKAESRSFSLWNPWIRWLLTSVTTTISIRNLRWWCQLPEKNRWEAEAYARTLREHYTNSVEDVAVGIHWKTIGREGAGEHCNLRMLAYFSGGTWSKAEKQIRLVRERMLKASNELGFGNDWGRLLEMVKETYFPEGRNGAARGDSFAEER